MSMASTPRHPRPAAPRRAAAGGDWGLAFIITAAAAISGAVGSGIALQVFSGWSPLLAAGLAATVAISGAALIVWRTALREDELRRLSAEAERLRQRDDESRRLELLGTLAAGLAHELGQPLSAARVGIEGVHYLRQLGREPSPEHLARTLSRVGLSLVAMTQTIEHLRGLAGPAAPVPAEPVDLAALVEAVLAERDQWLRYADTRISWTRPEQPAFASGDPAGIRLILVNLLRNAVEAVAGQGEDRRVVRITASGATLAVHDSGPGIAAERLGRIFDPFFSTKAGHGRGIGLSLAKASAERMGAELVAQSTVGAGTIFTLRLLPALRSGAYAPVARPR